MTTIATLRPAPAFSSAATKLLAIEDASMIRGIVRSTVQAAIEVLAGTRPVQQLARRLDHKCLAALQHRVALIRREAARTGSPLVTGLHRNSAVRSVRICHVAEGVYEASAVVVDELRVRAVAVRMERNGQVWRVTELVIG